MSGHYIQIICIAARFHHQIGVSYAGSLYHRDFWIRGCYEPPRIKNLTLLYMLLFYKHNNLNVFSVDRHHYQFHFSVKMERATWFWSDKFICRYSLSCTLLGRSNQKNLANFVHMNMLMLNIYQLPFLLLLLLLLCLLSATS